MSLDWDVVNEDCADISDWTDNDEAGCASTQETYDSKSCFKFDCPSSAADGNVAWRYRQPANVPDTFTIEIDLYIVSPAGGYENFQIAVYTTSGHLYVFYVYDNWISVRIDASTVIWLYVDDITDGWHTFRFNVKSSRKVDVWMDNRCYAAGVAITNTSVQTDYIYLINRSDNATEKVTYLDNFKMDTTAEAPTTESNLKIHGEQIVTRYVQGATGSYYTDVLRMYGPCWIGASAVLGLPLVDTGDDNASKVRIYDGAATKALMKLPA